MFPKNRNTWANKSTLYGVTPATYENIVLYVSATGSDDNNGLSSGQALATVQEAIDRLPKYIRHNVTINVGAGTFDPFYLDGFNQEAGLFRILGTFGDPTLATGTVSGTSTAGTTSTLTDAAQTWTVNDLIGHILLVAGESRVITSNTVDTITVVGTYSATTNGKAYHIYEPKSVISGQNSFTESAGDSTSFKSSVLVRNSNFIDASISRLSLASSDNSNYMLYCYQTNGITLKENFISGFSVVHTTQRGIYLKNTNKINIYDNDITNTYYGVYCDSSICGQLYRTQAIGNNIGFYFYRTNAETCNALYGITNNADGFQIADESSYVSITSIVSNTNTANGITNYGTLDISGGTISTNVNGIVVGNSTGTVRGKLSINSATTIVSNSTDGIVGWDNSYLNVRYAQGVNTGYGVRCKNCNTLIHSNGNTTIIGAANTYTLDDGSNSATDWTTNFVANNDSLVELTTNTIAIRRD